jgi:hypothetical protein
VLTLGSMPLNFHEDLKRAEVIRGSSDRNFGLVFALAFTVLGLAPLRKHGHIRIWMLVVAGVFLVVAIFKPSILHFLNVAWTKLGLLLSKVMNPIVTALMFFLVFTPAAAIARMLGKDPLRLKLEPKKGTYWIVRQPPGPQPDSMSRQF